MSRTTAVSLVLVLVLAGAACGGPAADSKTEEPAAAQMPPKAAAAGPAQAEPGPAEPAQAAVPTDRVEDPTFELAAVPAGPYAPGKLGSFAVSLKPRGEYHINQDYPMSVSVSPSAAVDFPKAELEKPEAAQFDEQVARFDVPFTPKSAGSHTIEAKVRFAVCTPENCVPDERTLAVVLPVE